MPTVLYCQLYLSIYQEHQSIYSFLALCPNLSRFSLDLSACLCQPIHRSIYLYTYFHSAWLFVIYQSKCILFHYLPSYNPYHIKWFYHILSYLALSDLSNYLQYICPMHIEIIADLTCVCIFYTTIWGITSFALIPDFSIQGSLLQSNLHVTWEGFTKGESYEGKSGGKRQNQHFTLGWKDGGWQKNVTNWKVFCFEVGDRDRLRNARVSIR